MTNGSWGRLWDEFPKTFAILCKHLLAAHGAEPIYMNRGVEEVLLWVTPQNPHRRVRIVEDGNFPHCECLEIRLKRSGWFKKSEEGQVIAFAVRPELALDWLMGLKPAGLQYLPSLDRTGYQLAGMDAVKAASIFRKEVVDRTASETETDPSAHHRGKPEDESLCGVSCAGGYCWLPKGHTGAHSVRG